MEEKVGEWEEQLEGLAEGEGTTWQEPLCHSDGIFTTAVRLICVFY